MGNVTTRRGALDENDVTRSPYLVNASITFKGGRRRLFAYNPGARCERDMLVGFEGCGHALLKKRDPTRLPGLSQEIPRCSR
jgi:hypothetical protein